jgi:methylation protein EvaC
MHTKDLASCSFCNGRSMSLIMDFGNVALAGSFITPDSFEDEARYPLRLFYCHDCYSVQVIDKVDPEVLFRDYFYFSSSIKTLSSHFTQYAEDVTRRFLNPETSSVLEIGCNDGVLLRPLADLRINRVIGVDPAENIISTINDPRITVVNNFFNEGVAKEIVEKYGAVDLVCANNVFAHIPDIQGVTRAIHSVLGEDGVFIFEVHYLGNVINELQYDMIYHEHLFYYSLLSAIKHFERYEMMIFDVEFQAIHAGSIRFYVAKKGSKHSKEVSPAVMALEKEERKKGFDNPKTFYKFAADIEALKIQLMDLLTKLKGEGYTIAGYGASGRANTIIQYCNIDNNFLDYMIDDAPAKSGFFTPGSHFKIYPSSILSEPNPPDYLLLFAWSFLDEIVKRNKNYINSGGQFIVPLPNVKKIPIS